ncbi:ATP-grasp domain-containing protein [Candidatus Saccharibacteria bacterium]|nr:MAG: ATP-grasp domain-containing protein [Candidatus Saccharibacteria bacterium]
MTDQPTVLCVGRRESGEKNDVHIMSGAIEKAGINSSVIYWENLIFHITSERVTVSDPSEGDANPRLALLLNWTLNGDLAFVRDIAYSFGLFLDQRSVQLWNSEVLSQRSTTKLSCMVQLALAGYAVPETLYSLNGHSLAEHVLRTIPGPWIVKSIKSSRGRDNFLVRTEAELQELLSDTSMNSFMVQEFIPNNFDLRVICFGGEPAMIIRRSRAKDSETHLNNTSAGGSAEQIPLSELPAKLRDTARGIARTMRRELAGIDFIIDSSSEKEYICLEVNSIPQLTSGSYVNEKMVNFSQSVVRSLNKNVENI